MTINDQLKGAWKTVGWGLLWIIGALWFCHYMFGNPLEELPLILRAEIAPGQILSTWEEAGEGDEGGTSWLHGCSYTFRTPDGATITKKTHPSPGPLADEFRDLQEPYPIQVEFLPDKPSISRIKGDGSATLFEWLWRDIGLGGFILVVLVSPGVGLFRDGVCLIRDLKRASRRRSI